MSKGNNNNNKATAKAKGSPKESAKQSVDEDFPPLEGSQDDFRDLVAQAAQLTLSEAQEEWLECARFGEADALRAMVERFPSLSEHSDPVSGNTALHMAAANGHVSVARLLLCRRVRHPFTKNKAGNTPLHWAASNGQSEMVKYLTGLENSESLYVDVLEQNEFGRSALTEGFTSQAEDVVAALLEHESAAEEKLLSSTNKSKETSITHDFFDKDKPLRIRELAIANADTPFADAERPDQDTTGFSIWSASLVLARWLQKVEMKERWGGASVLELGAGCAVPALAVASSTPSPRRVYITDLNPKTVENMEFNIKLNGFSSDPLSVPCIAALCMDWDDKNTWPEEKVDFVIGSDLIYQSSLVPLLSRVIWGLLKPGGTFFYVAPDTGRDGLEEFIEEMKSRCPDHQSEVATKEYYHENPLANQDDDECFLHFTELSSLTFVLHEFRKPENE